MVDDRLERLWARRLCLCCCPRCWHSGHCLPLSAALGRGTAVPHGPQRYWNALSVTHKHKKKKKRLEKKTATESVTQVCF